MESPWDYEDVVRTFISLTSLAHIIVQLAPVTSVPPVLLLFQRRTPWSVKLRLVLAAPEWWHNDWVEDCVNVPFERGDRRMEYTGLLW